MRRIAKVALILVAGGIIAQAALAAIWYESYRKADDALRAGQWEEAVRYLNEAIELKSDSNARARTYGVNFIAYFPYLKLGTAYYQMGQLEAASQALDREEQLQAIGRSPSDLVELKRIRELIQKAQESRAADEQKRIQGLVSASLEEASRAEAQGKWDDAIAAANRALAIAANDQAAKDVLSRLQIKVSQAEREREQESRAAALVKEGETFLAEGQYQSAAGKFAEALSIQDSGRARTLLEDAQARLRAQVTAGQDPQARRQKIASVLKAARGLQAEGRFNEALVKLQEALALDPSNDEAKILQGSLTSAVSSAAEARSRADSMTGLLDEAKKTFAAGSYEASLAGADRVLALAPDNAEAREIKEVSIKLLSARLLGDPKPVIIPFGQQRYGLGNGLFAERVSRSSFELRGSVSHKNEILLRVRLEHFPSPREFKLPDGSAPAGQAERGELLEAVTRVEDRGETSITQYSVRRVLRPGISVFSVSAGDPRDAGISQTSRYLVYYVPPFYTAAWFFGAVAGALALSAGSVYGLKRRRRTLLSKRRFNPYVAGAPVLQDDLFFGREELLKRVLQSIHNNSIMLYGERRIGKTSFQHHLKKKLAGLDDPEYKFHPVFIDLQGVPQERFFATLRDEIFRELAPVLGDARPGPAPPAGSAYDYRELVDDVRMVLKILGGRSVKMVKLVLQMDEVDQLNGYDPRVNQRLRSLFMRNFSENLAAVVSGVSIQKRWEGEGSPWYNFFEEIEVGPLRREDAAELVERPIRGKFKLEKGVTERILSATGCKPYLVQKMCIALVNRMHDGGRRTVTLADVEGVGRPAEA